MYGRGACAGFALQSAARIETNPTGWGRCATRSKGGGHALPERADRRRNPAGHTNHATAAATRIAPAPVRPSSQVGGGGDERRGKREERRGGREREDRITQGGVSPWTCTAVDIRTGIDGGGEAAAAWWWYQLPLLAAQPAHIGSAASRSAAV